MPRFSDTIAALATPAGTSALALLRVSGPQAAALSREIFGATAPPRTVQHGDYRDRSAQLLDDVLWTFFAAPNSYSGEDSLEISCHGNPFIAQRILEDLLARGCRPAGPGEFTQRAFLNGRMDLSQAEAVMDLIHARSDRALAAANRQLRGALGRRMEFLIDGLLRSLARVEAHIDFPEEDLPAEDQASLVAELERLRAESGRLLATGRYGEMLRHGIRTVIIGAPNAGKSSVLNRLLGRERALVSPEPGTTRDYIEEPLSLGPHALRLIDTAGFNPHAASLERRGIEKTLEHAADADLLLLVVDATADSHGVPVEVRDRLDAANTLVLWNKTDLPASGATPSPALMSLPAVRLSALTGSGFEELVAVITRFADRFQMLVGDDMVAINARHADSLSRARDGLGAAIEKIRTRVAAELVASDLRIVLEAYGEISGRIENDQMLDRLFATFCIGK